MFKSGIHQVSQRDAHTIHQVAFTVFSHDSFGEVPRQNEFFSFPL